MPPEENEAGQEKTEPATPRRRQKAREKGMVARSKEVNSAAILFFALMIFTFYGPHICRQLMEYIRYSFIHFPEIEITRSSIQKFAVDRIFFLLKLVIPVFIVFIIVGVLSNILQFGWLFTKQTIFQGLKNFSLNPMKAFRKMLSPNSFVTLGLDFAKLFVLVIVVYKTLKDEIVKFPSLVSIPIMDSVRYMARLLFFLTLKIIVFLIIIGIIDFIWQRHKHEKSLKMTKEEIKEEMKAVEGDPKVRAQIRQSQMKMVMSHMIQKVPEADVVVTNPFHIAVALKYDPNIADAPVVIAKGARLIAERIKDIARMSSVPIIENKPLARTLYKTVEVGQMIPEKLYEAVAKILSYVYSLNDERRRMYSKL